ncbi:hypothetical protein CEQ21_06265 [Niallia circulans]|uniref:Xylose isomerase-like TIM barrel domain-containing protein n=1 Tax=Niallia circulans TaxID=1397 RepID=A0A553SU35_NIACI|nr:TIM barrel protein [Niallia circulans]TRZ40505.1 hypothetical protein CEQ21_06265 [Niallia circulans]
MKQWQEMLEISLVHPGLWPNAANDEKVWEHSIRTVLEDSFFERIEIAPIANSNRRRQFAEWLRVANMNASYLLQPLIFGKELNLHSSNKEEQMQAVNQIMQAMDDAVEAGADRVAVISGPKNLNEQYEDELQRLCDSLLLLDKAAKERNLQLDLELFDTDIDKNRFFGNSNMAAHLMNLLEKHTTNLSLLVDLSHVPLLGEDIEETVHNTNNWLGHVHIGNCSIDRKDDRFGDKHPYFGYQNGCHSVPEVAAFLKDLIEVGYINRSGKAGLGIEIMTTAGEEPGLLMAGAKRTLIKALQALEDAPIKDGE